MFLVGSQLQQAISQFSPRKGNQNPTTTSLVSGTRTAPRYLPDVRQIKLTIVHDEHLPLIITYFRILLSFTSLIFVCRI